MAYIDEELEKLKTLIDNEQEKIEPIVAASSRRVGFEEYFTDEITNNLLKTMSMEYDNNSSTLRLQTFKDNMDNVIASIEEFPMAVESYEAFCTNVLKLDVNAKYNDSSNVVINGTPVRVFAIMPPYKNNPLIVMSTSKRPPEKINHLSSQEEAKLVSVLQSNFLICGKSGAGKTYLLNYLLSKYFPKNRRVGIIQEFLEIYSPNDFTDQITVPPRKPEQEWNDLEFLTEQSNLMRYDTLLVGEIKGSEAWPFVCNLASGTTGGATIHGNSTQNALQRLRMLCLLAKENLSETVVDSFIAKAVKYVVYVEDGNVANIDKIVSVNRGNFALESL